LRADEPITKPGFINAHIAYEAKVAKVKILKVKWSLPEKEAQSSVFSKRRARMSLQSHDYEQLH